MQVFELEDAPVWRILSCRGFLLGIILCTRAGRAIFSMPLNNVTHPRMVLATLQSETQMLCATTVAKPNKKVI